MDREGGDRKLGKPTLNELFLLTSEYKKIDYDLDIIIVCHCALVVSNCCDLGPVCASHVLRYFKQWWKVNFLNYCT